MSPTESKQVIDIAHRIWEIMNAIADGSRDEVADYLSDLDRLAFLLEKLAQK